MITVDELNNGRSGGAFTRTIEYLVIGTDSDAEMSESDAIQAVVTATPEEYDGLARKDAQINGLWYTPTQAIARIGMQWGELDGGGGGGGVFEPPGTDTSAYEFAYQAPSGHINYALSTTAYGTDPPDYGLKINVTPDGEHLGLELPSGNVTNVWRRTVPPGFINNTYESTVEAMMGSTNSAIFAGRPIGTMRLVSVQSQAAGGGSSSISWGFQYSANRTGLTIAGIAGVAIGGHQLWWQLDEKSLDTTAKKVVIGTRAIYVHTVVPSADFAALQI